MSIKQMDHLPIYLLFFFFAFIYEFFHLLFQTSPKIIHYAKKIYLDDHISEQNIFSEN